MRHSAFPKSLAVSLGSLMLGAWLGPVGVILAHPQYPDQWVCSSAPTEWEWSGEASAPDTGPVGGPSPSPSKNPEQPSDPTSALNPFWDNLPTEESWSISIPPAEGEPLSDASLSEPSEESSESLSETSTDTSPLLEDGEVQSMQEYFQRYGSTYAGSELRAQTTTQTNASFTASEQENSSEMEQEDPYNLPEDVSAHQPDSKDSDSAEPMNPTPSEPQGESEDLQEPENQQDMPQDQSEPSASSENQLLDTPSENRSPSAEPWSPWGYESGYESVEAEYHPSEPGVSSESEKTMKSESSDETSPPDTPDHGASQNETSGEEHLTPPAEPLPQDRYEYPEQEWKDWPETDAYSEQKNDQPVQNPSTEASPEEESSSMEQEASLEDKEETPSPMAEKVAPEMNAPEEVRQESPENESSRSAMPGQESNSTGQQLGPSASSSYQWWLENPDTWTEESSGQTSTAETPQNNGGSSDASSQPHPEEAYPMEGEETSEESEEETSSDEAMNRDVSVEEDSEGESSSDSEDPGEENAASFHSSEEYRHVHPSLLEGLGQSLLRLLEPWRKTLSGIWEISAGPNWFTGSFPTGQEKTEQEGAATRPSEAVAR